MPSLSSHSCPPPGEGPSVKVEGCPFFLDPSVPSFFLFSRCTSNKRFRRGDRELSELAGRRASWWSDVATPSILPAGRPFFFFTTFFFSWQEGTSDPSPFPYLTLRVFDPSVADFLRARLCVSSPFSSCSQLFPLNVERDLLFPDTNSSRCPPLAAQPFLSVTTSVGQ